MNLESGFNVATLIPATRVSWVATTNGLISLVVGSGIEGQILLVSIPSLWRGLGVGFSMTKSGRDARAPRSSS